MLRWMSRWTSVLTLTLIVALALALLPGGAAFAAAGTTCTTAAGGVTTCTTTDASGSVLGTCTVSGAASCTPAVSGAGSGQVSSNLQSLQQELTPNVGAVLTNPVTAPLVKMGMFVLSLVILWFLFSSLFELAKKVHEQAKGEGGITHQNLHGALFAVGALLLLVAGGATWLLVGVVQGFQTFLHG